MKRDQPQRAVVFAYHQVGVRCLSVLLASGLDVRLVLTHRDSDDENVWWQSVSELADRAGIPVITPEDPNDPEVVARIRACMPRFIFSFYYRHMLKSELLQIPTMGAYNMHGSLLPKYRGRVPVNWALINGEQRSGTSLHRMELKPDAGNLVGQEAVVILPNDTAHDLFLKLVCAAEKLLLELLPKLLAGEQQEQSMDLSLGSYFGGRKPADGEIDWSQPAWDIHNLIRALAPPYPGAFTEIEGNRLLLLGSYWRGEYGTGDTERIYWQSGRCYADCSDGRRIELTRIELNGLPLDEEGFTRLFDGELRMRSCNGERR